MKRGYSQRLSFAPETQRDAARHGIKREGAVYFLAGECTGLIKIGWSKDPIYRARDIAAECSERLLYLGTLGPCGRSRETDLHRQFAHHREVGEWFRLGDDLCEYLRRELNLSELVLLTDSELDTKPPGEQKSDAKV
jgi:hypothetical protein